MNYTLSGGALATCVIVDETTNGVTINCTVDLPTEQATMSPLENTSESSNHTDNTTYYDYNTTYYDYNTTYYDYNTTYYDYNTTYYDYNTTNYESNTTYEMMNNTDGNNGSVGVYRLNPQELSSSENDNMKNEVSYKKNKPVSCTTSNQKICIQYSLDILKITIQNV